MKATKTAKRLQNFFADYDEATAMFCVFDDSTGKAHSSWASMAQAQTDADKRNGKEVE